MKAIKRTVAALLATLMLATSTSFTLAAEDYSKDEAVVVAKVNAAGIMTGTDKGFEPSKSLTRAEAAAIIVRMKGISESAVKSAAGTTLFKDVAAAHWASGYVNQASNLGIVKGVSATEFAPDREVTVAEFVTMAIRALGAGTMVDAEGTWPSNYVNFANEEGLLDDVNAIYTATASRMNAATIVANTLEANMWAKTAATTKNEITYAETDDTILNDVLKIDYLNALTVKSVNKVDREVEFEAYVDSDKKLIVEGSTNVAIDSWELAETVDLSNIKVGEDVDVWFKTKSKEIILIVPASESTQSTIEFTEITDAATLEDDGGTPAKITEATIEVKVNGKDKEFDLALSADKKSVATVVYENGKINPAFDFSAITAADEYTFGTLTLVNNKVTYIYFEKYQKMGVVKEITSKYIKPYGSSDVTYSIGSESIKIDEDYVYNVTKDGKVATLDDIKEGDAYYFYKNEKGDEYTIAVFTTTVEGTVKSINVSNKEIKLDSKTYDADAKFVTGADKVELKDEIIAYLDKQGRIAAVEEVEGAAGEVAVVSYYKEYDDKYGWANAEVKLTFMDGTTSEVLTIDVEESLKELGKYNSVKESSAKGTYTCDEGTDTFATVKAKLGLGTPVYYSISGSELTVKDLSAGDDAEWIKAAKFDLSVVKSNIKVTNTDWKDPEKHSDGYNKVWALGKSDLEYGYLADNANILVVKDSTKSNKVVVEKVSIKDITKGTEGLVGFFAGIDGTTISNLIIDETGTKKAINKAATTSVYAVALTATDVYENDDDDKDIEYDVVFSDGNRDKVYWINGTSDSDDKLTALTDSAAVIYKLTLNGNVIVGTEVVDADKVTGVTEFTDIDDDRINDTYFADDNAIVVEKITKSGKVSFEVRDLSDIEEYDATEVDTGDKYDGIMLVYTSDIDDDTSNEDVVIFVLYAEATK